MDMDMGAGPGDGPHYCYGDLCERGGRGQKVGVGWCGIESWKGKCSLKNIYVCMLKT